MYKIEKKDFGYKITFGDMIMAPEMKKWLEETKEILKTAPAKFGMLVDMRTLKPLPEESQPYMQEGQKLYKTKGMERSVVILANAVVTLQFKRIGKETGIYAFERYIDASTVKDWEAVGINWLKFGKDPDKK